MNYEEFKRQLGKAGLTIKAFAEIIGLNPVSITNYAKVGEVPSHLAIIVVLMGEMAEQNLDFRKALARVKIETKKGRGTEKRKFGAANQQNLLSFF